MNTVIYRIKSALATIFVAILGYALLQLVFENWYAGETNLVLRNSPNLVLRLSEEPFSFYLVLGLYTLVGFFLSIYALYLAYQTIFATPESITRTRLSSRFFFGKSDPGLLWVGGILLVAFLFLIVKLSWVSNYAIKGTAVKILVSSFASAAAVPNFGC